jgi:fructose 1,6-bisphosphate aldolase/phosphatase
MKTTLSIIKADIGSIGGHIKPSGKLMKRVEEFVNDGNKGLVSDFFVCHTGDDVAILFAHSRGTGNPEVHRLAWDAFVAGTEVARNKVSTERARTS